MRHHWLEDRIQDNTIQFIWRPDQFNRVDYPSHHRKMRSEYLVNVIQRQQRNVIDDYYTSATRQQRKFIDDYHTSATKVLLMNIIQQQKNRAMRDHDTHTH